MPQLRSLAFCVLLSSLPLASLAQEGGPPPANVEVAPLTRGAVKDELQLTGTILPQRYSSVASAVDGLVEEVLFDAGDALPKDAPMVRLRSVPTELELESAKAQVALQEARLAELLNGTRPEDVASARAAVADAQARERLASIDRDRLQRLLSTNTISQAEFDRAQAELDRASAETARAQAALDRALKGPREEEIAAARAELAAAQADVKRLEDRLDRHTIRAPYDGVVGSKDTESGAWIGEGDAVAVFASTELLWVEASVPERHFNSVREGTPVRLTVEALAGHVLDAKVAKRIPVSDLASRTFPVRIEVKNPDHTLAPGMFARVTMELEPRENARADALLVPKDAVVTEPNGAQKVYTVSDGEKGPIALPQTIRTGRSFGALSEVVEAGGLTEGTLVIVRGNETIMFPGQPLNIVKSEGGEGTGAQVAEAPASAPATASAQP